MIITLLTDFGTRDYFVGAMKGVILSVNENASIVDITHEIAPQNIRAAAFTLKNYYKNFLQGTIHVCVVDPGVGSNRRAILVETEDYCFVAPDNGLLSFVLAEQENFRAFELNNTEFFHYPVSQTFHGRDIFAPVAAHLSNGVLPEELGTEIDDLATFEISVPRAVGETKIEVEIIHIDHFGNLVTNLKAEDLPEKFYLEAGENRIERHQRFFTEAEKSEIFSITGSAGFLEIAAFQDSAEKLLNAKTGEKVYLIKQGN
ncbi:MAG: SAM hydrolase/SAM-dependent halogenase family protein [Pyrinomonadaceae bacterium]